MRRCPSRGAQFTAHSMQWNRMGSNNVNNYGVGEGPMANLLRIIRDAPRTPNTNDIYTAATEEKVGVHSRRHMKGLLNCMRKLGRIQTRPPSEREPGEEKGKAKNFVFSLTEKGAMHIAKIDQAMKVQGKSQQR